MIRFLQTEAFRNLNIPRLEVSPGITVFYGDNGQGKTNILEAVYFCALGRPLRADKVGELIPMGAESAHIRAGFVDAVYAKALIPSSFTVDACITGAGGKYMKAISIDRVPVNNTRDLFGKAPVVSFSPEDLSLVKDGPSARRRFMDIEICQISPVYYKTLRMYYSVLRQRNHLLRLAQKNPSQAEGLSVWDAQLAEHGTRIMGARASYIAKISTLAGEIHKEITQNTEELALVYKPAVSDTAAFTTLLERNQRRDIIQGSTSVGIHRDDVSITVHDISARAFGSRGQIRTAVLSVKLAEIALIKEHKGIFPLVLLDDVFSELDAARARYLLKQIQDMQVLITCTGLEDIPARISADAKVLRVKEGRIL